MTAPDTIRELAMPVVMISANGLMCLALYNRLAAITARLRLFFRERFDVDIRLAEQLTANNPAVEERLKQRLRSLTKQSGLVLRRARQIRNALMFLLASVVGQLVTMLLLGLTYQVAFLAPLALLTFVASILIMITGILLAIGELVAYLGPVEAEELELNNQSIQPDEDSVFGLAPPSPVENV
jgi:hypothetical protein